MTENLPTPTKPRSRWKVATYVLIGVLLWLRVADFPEPPAPPLDPSWQAILTNAYIDGLQYGKEVIFSMGPWGWVNSHYVQPDAFWPKIIWEFTGRALMCAALVLLAMALPRIHRALFLVAVFLFGTFSADTIPIALIVLASLHWLMKNASPAWVSCAVAVAIAFAAQMKITYALIAIPAVALATVSLAFRKQWIHGALIPSVFSISYFVWWFAAGQNFVRLSGFWRHSREISRGYIDAMFLDGPGLVLFLSFVALVLTLGAVLWASIRAERRLLSIPAAILLAGGLLLGWKHGFIRADGHVLGFFSLCLLLALSAPWIIGWKSRFRLFELSALISVGGIMIADPSLFGISAALARNDSIDNFIATTRIGSLRKDYDSDFRHNAYSDGLGEISEIVGDATVDMMGHEQGRLLLSELNYRPRPVFQSYKAYTPLLLARNLRFLQSENAPEYVVVRIQTIDRRHPMGDDSLALAELFRRYEYVMSNSQFVLMRTRATPPASPDLARESQMVTTLRLGQTLELPDNDEAAQWIHIIGYPTMLGKIRSATLRHAALYMVSTLESGREIRHRVVLPAAAEGFLVNPLVENAADFAAALRGLADKRVASIRFEAETEDAARYWDAVGVNIARLPEIRLLAKGVGTDAYVAGVFERPPLSLSSSVECRLSTIGDRTEIQVHAPGEVSFDATGATAMRGNFRIRDGAYLNGGETDGAEFLVEALKADGESEVVFYRFLNPLENEVDRGMQSFSARLPEGTTTVTLYTLPGPENRNNWDWTMWSDISFSADAGSE